MENSNKVPQTVNSIQPARHRLFDDNQPNTPEVAAVGQMYFQNVPKAFLFIVCWFSYLALSGIAGIVQAVYVLFVWWQQPSIQMLIVLVPFVTGILGFFIVWGLIKQKSWVKILVGVWYALVLLTAGYVIYALLSQGAYNYLSPQNLLSFSLLIVIVPAVVIFAVNTFVAYYVFAKASLNN